MKIKKTLNPDGREIIEWHGIFLAGRWWDRSCAENKLLRFLLDIADDFWRVFFFGLYKKRCEKECGVPDTRDMTAPHRPGLNYTIHKYLGEPPYRDGNRSGVMPHPDIGYKETIGGAHLGDLGPGESMGIYMKLPD